MEILLKSFDNFEETLSKILNFDKVKFAFNNLHFLLKLNGKNFNLKIGTCKTLLNNSKPLKQPQTIETLTKPNDTR